MKTCLKTRADVDYDEESDEDEDKGDEYKDSKWMNMSKMKKLIKTIARGDFEYNRKDNEY